ncbi:GatB/YqeY domain-containing protein [Caldisalinibacter kiritimatiensis]|uniref:Transamidase GatB domain protein n=1 Tax=Caldisalinibacter kiritimatiensis TaxID=1304284 RepID=R1CER5_9FIRM|nr:GatB/YqeY domain-containing protein [Caldisalinibacter kiritimatiensis]EOD00800.1 Transamidase GatB domain protein [Caldisalinibacter kiritimatiensis]
MALKEKLMNDLKAAMKDKDKVRKNVITMVRSAIKQREVDERVELEDEQIIEIISKQVKQKKDAIEEFNKGGREDLIELTQKEIDILMEYLPRQLTEEEIDELVREAIDAVGANSKKDIGKVMSYVMPKVKGKADGKTVNKIVMQHLQ